MDTLALETTLQIIEEIVKDEYLTLGSTSYGDRQGKGTLKRMKTLKALSLTCKSFYFITNPYLKQYAQVSFKKLNKSSLAKLIEQCHSGPSETYIYEKVKFLVFNLSYKDHFPKLKNHIEYGGIAQYTNPGIFRNDFKLASACIPYFENVVRLDLTMDIIKADEYAVALFKIFLAMRKLKDLTLRIRFGVNTVIDQYTIGLRGLDSNVFFRGFKRPPKPTLTCLRIIGDIYGPGADKKTLKITEANPMNLKVLKHSFNVVMGDIMKLQPFFAKVEHFEYNMCEDLQVYHDKGGLGLGYSFHLPAVKTVNIRCGFADGEWTPTVDFKVCDRVEELCFTQFRLKDLTYSGINKWLECYFKNVTVLTLEFAEKILTPEHLEKLYCDWANTIGMIMERETEDGVPVFQKGVWRLQLPGQREFSQIDFKVEIKPDMVTIADGYGGKDWVGVVLSPSFEDLCRTFWN